MNDHFAPGIQNGAANTSFLKSKLGYIRDLGFNAIELMPIQEFQQDRSWGYNPSFYHSVESAYGSPDQMRDFVAEAHRYGLAVLFDVVYNHVNNSDNSLWNWDTYQGQADHGEYLYPPYNTEQHRLGAGV
jgi:1,4-alpha-glucan branching enzyme